MDNTNNNHHQDHQSTALVGVIADTHGFLSKQALDALQGVDLIIHAGDFDSIHVLERLEKVAPVKAVRGNTDFEGRLRDLPQTAAEEVGEVQIFVIHDLGELDLVPETAGFQVVIYGHYHLPEVSERQGVLFLNPGSASFPRGGSKKSLALLQITAGRAVAELKSLE